KPVGARDLERRAPRAVEDELVRILRDRLGEERLRIAARGPGEALPERIAEDARGLLRLREAVGGNLALERAILHRARAGIVDAVQELARDAKRRRHDAAGISRVHALGE